MKKNLVGILLMGFVAATIVGCQSPQVVTFPDGSKTVEAYGRKCHVSIIELDGKKYVVAVNSTCGFSVQPVAGAEKDAPKWLKKKR